MPVGIRRLLVVLAVAGAGLVPVPATAATCSGTGVSVVVDFGALGGGIRTGCDASGNRKAAQAFERTGNHLEYAQRQPGFVCRVDAAPANDPCINTAPADAYWGLYWSDGTSGWKYASTAVGSLTLPAGGSVAFSWQNGGGDPPGIAPASAAPATQAPARSPTPAPTPTKKASTKPAPVATPGGTSSASSTPTAAGSPSVSTSASAKPSSTDSPASTTTASPDASAAARSGAMVDAPSTDPADADGLAWWVPMAVLVLLAGGGGAAWWTRRRGSS